MSPPLQITEDTPPDMLAGSMDLCVVLPNGHNVKMSVERSTPMMDLLVQVTTANKISPAGHVIQAVGERGVMPYKPSTPIGALDTWMIYIVPKNQVGQVASRKGFYKSSSQPFEQTFRLQVHLPRNQLYVSRISPKTRVSDILLQVCSEKNLDPSKYSFRHPVNLDQVLNASSCLADHKLQEVALVSNRSRPPLCVSTVDIMALQQHQQQQQHSDNFNAVRNHRSCEGSLSSGSLGGRSLSPTRSDGSSASPPPLPLPTAAPNRPIRKRRPAPKPPVNNNNNNNSNASVSVHNAVNKNNNNNKNSNKISNADNNRQQQQMTGGQGSCPPTGTTTTVICHSRNSSDSSGYHEASVLSESPESNSLPDSLPRRSKLPSNENSMQSTSSVKSAGILSRSLSNLTTADGVNAARSMKTHSTSSTSLIAIGRKKKAAPPPPQARSLKMSSVSEERQKDISCAQASLVLDDDNDDEDRNSICRKSSTLPASIRVASSCASDNMTSAISSSSVGCVPDTVDDVTAPSTLTCSSLDLLKNTPSVKQPKPRPRTIFETDCIDVDEINKEVDSVCSAPLSPSCSSSVAGDGCCSESTNSTLFSRTVNRPKPCRSRKSYPAPLPKPRSSQLVGSSSNETETVGKSVNDRLALDIICDVENIQQQSCGIVDSNTLSAHDLNAVGCRESSKEIKVDDWCSTGKDSMQEEPVERVLLPKSNRVTETIIQNDSIDDSERLYSSAVEDESYTCGSKQVLRSISNTSSNSFVTVSSAASSTPCTSAIDDESPCLASEQVLHSTSFVTVSSSSSTTTTTTTMQTTVVDTTNKVEPKASSLSDENLVRGNAARRQLLSAQKGRHFSAGNLDDIPAFLVDGTCLGRWRNAECLPESCSDACGSTEADTETTKTNSSTSDLRMDDDEIDRIFQNAMRDHTSLESGVGDDDESSPPPGTVIVSEAGALPSPPLSLTHRPLAVTGSGGGESGPDSLDWEYRLPAPPTFRDDTSSPVMTVFDTVTIGNLTDVFRPVPSIDCDKKITETPVTYEPDLVNNVATMNSCKLDDGGGDLEDTPTKHNELVISKTKHNKTVERIVEKSINESTKPDLIKHSLAVEEEKERERCRDKKKRDDEIRRVDDVTKAVRTPTLDGVSSAKSRLVDARANVLDNFVIMTYQESGGKKPVEVFEDDSVKSSSSSAAPVTSSGDKKLVEVREKTSMFRIPKSVPRRFESLAGVMRRSSFGSEDKQRVPGQVTVKRSASHVSLLAGNVARGPYSSSAHHLARSNCELADKSHRLQSACEPFGGAHLRKINSQVNVNCAQGDEEKSKFDDWRNTGSVGLQSLQVLRSILPQLNNSHDSIVADNDDEDDCEYTSKTRVASDLPKKFERSHSEVEEADAPSSDYYMHTPTHAHAHTPPAVSFSTWNERPKRQVSIKTDRDYCYGIGKTIKKSQALGDDSVAEDEQSGSPKRVSSDTRQTDLDKPDIIKHSTADLSHVPVVRAVELKKKPYFSTSCLDVTDLNRNEFFHGRSFENLSCLDSAATFSKSNTTNTNELYKSQQSVNSITNQEEPMPYSGVNSLLKKFGQQKTATTNRPVSYYLYGSDNKQQDERIPPKQSNSNTSRVLLNSERRFTSVVGINNDAEDDVNKSAFLNSSHQLNKTNRVFINGASCNDDQINGNVSKVEMKNAVNSSLEFIKAQSKISSGGFVLDSPPPSTSDTNCRIKPVSVQKQANLRQSSTAAPVKSADLLQKPSAVKQAQSSGGIPPPPPVMPTLKPVGDRKHPRSVPRVQADPRDQLLESIRNFGGKNSLKKISSK